MLAELKNADINFKLVVYLFEDCFWISKSGLQFILLIFGEYRVSDLVSLF